MHARVTTALLQPGKLDEGTSITKHSIAPAAKQQKGFKEYLFLTDRNTGKCLSITLWETEADMRANETSGYWQEQIAKVAPHLAGPPTMEHYEVTIRE